MFFPWRYDTASAIMLLGCETRRLIITQKVTVATKRKINSRGKSKLRLEVSGNKNKKWMVSLSYRVKRSS